MSTQDTQPLTDLAIARSIPLKPITAISEALGIEDDELEQFGKYKAKIDANGIRQRLADKPNGRYVVVTAITPTPLGEGKSLTTIGLSIALNRIGKKTIGTVRQPSAGPVFGVKGGAAGGGYSQVLPMEDFNLHLTGDIHAIALAHNLIAAVIDNHLTQGNELGIDALSITWPRVVDLNDRSLRHITIGLGGSGNGVPRETRFDIAVASELMAILGLSADWRELRKRVGNVTIGYTKDRKPVTVHDLKAEGAVTVLLRQALQPTLMQTTEYTPIFVHTGPFANIAHGNSSIVADQAGLKLADFVVTESGFGADMGFEKFMDIKCRASGLMPDAAVVVCTVRALKMHSGKYKVVMGKPLDEGLKTEDLEAVRAGAVNLQKHIENVRHFGVPVVVAINRFSFDSDAELALVRELALAAGASAAETSTLWADGGAGGEALAKAVVAAAESTVHGTPDSPHFLYESGIPIKDKIHRLATEIYGADGVDYTPDADRMIRRYTTLGWDHFPICMAKTSLSLSDNGALKGRPTGFRITVKEVRAYSGAGFITPVAGEINTMPGMPSKAAVHDIDIDEDGLVVGLF